MGIELNQLINTRLGLMDLTIDEALLDYIKEEVVQSVLNYTNQNKLPKELYYVVAKMVVSSAAQLAIPDTSSSTPTDNLTASSIKVGDITVQLKQASSSTADLDARVSELLNDYRTELNAFRKLRW